MSERLEDIIKLAAEESERSGTKGALIGGAVGTGAVSGLAMSDPWIRGDVQTNIKKMLGKYQEEYAGKQHPQQAVDLAKKVADSLRKSGFDPKKHNLAIGATGGTGKSTLGALLAEELKLKMTHATAGTAASGKYIESIQRAAAKPGHVYEHTRLFTNVDPEKFDYAIKLERPTKTIFKGLAKRKKSALQRYISDYPKLKGAINTSFNSMEGSPVLNERFGDLSVAVKKKSPGGWKSAETLDKALEAKKINPSKIPTHLKSYYAGEGTSKGFGIANKLGLTKLMPSAFKPHTHYGNIASGLGIAAGAIIGGTMLGRHLAKRGGEAENEELKVSSLSPNRLLSIIRELAEEGN